MDKKKLFSIILKITVGCALFGLGFNLFLEPHGLNAGGISGLSMVLVHFIGVGSIGTVTALLNLPLFAIGGMKIGKAFFFESLLGMILLSVFIDVFALIPIPETEVLVGALYGGVICGLGLGMVFSAGGSTGGSDIIVRLLKLRYQNVPIGIINTVFDGAVAVLTGIVFQDVNRALYSGVAIFVLGRVIDAVVYQFDYSKVAIIISKKYDEIARRIGEDLDRGATFLNGQGVYSGNDTKVILSAVKKQQISELKELVVAIDPDAFIIVQEAHQVLGDGFARYSKFNL
ncbi:MAG: YitT family protein [Oscillospiraceae bacterium]|nr:YitT family protein [Oscillospiraceae bacterium]